MILCEQISDLNSILYCRQLLRDLVPSDLVKIQGTSEWKRSITTLYTQDAGMSSEDAKIAFLKIIYR